MSGGLPPGEDRDAIVAVEEFERGVKDFVIRKFTKDRKWQSCTVLWILGLYIMFNVTGIAVTSGKFRSLDR